jgi:hypothetical protein
MTRATPFAFVALVVAAPAAAQPSDPCARFEEPLAYNACLAAHGPRAPATRPAPAGDEAPGRVRHASHGRQRFEFDVGD